MSAFLVYQNGKSNVVLGPVFRTRGEAEWETESRNRSERGARWTWVELGTDSEFFGYIVTREQ